MSGLILFTNKPLKNCVNNIIGQSKTGFEEHHHQALVVDPNNNNNNNLVQDLMENEVSNEEHILVQEPIAREGHSPKRVLSKRKKASQHWTEKEHRYVYIKRIKYIFNLH